MKKLSYIFAAAALMTAAAVSCTKEAVVDNGNGEPVPSENTLVLKASHEDGLTKTSLADDGSVTWTAGDQLALVYTGGTIASAELGAEDAGQAAADFTFDLGDATVSDGYVVYPGSTAAAYDGSALTVTVPSVQDGTFAGAAIEVAAFDGEGISGLKNLGGLLQIKVESEVSEILISSNDGTALAGTAAVTFSDGIPGIESVSEASTSITLKVSGAGTYYAAVLPATIKAGLYIEMKSGEEVVGEKMSGSSLSVARKQIRNLGTIATGTYGNKLFVKTDGTGDGSSWDAALNYAGLIAHLRQTTTTGKNIYVAAGTYTSTAIAGTTITNTDFKIFGGYPADAAGTSLSGRDIQNHATIFDGNGTSRIFVISSPSVDALFDGCTFQNAMVGGGEETTVSGAGSALVFHSVKTANVVNCIIKDNGNAIGSSAGGAVRAYSGAITFSGCTFSGNHAAKGGAISVGNVETSQVTIKNCSFSGNYTDKIGENADKGNGGAIYQFHGTLNLSSCDFSGNHAANGGAIDIEPTKESTPGITIRDCSFTENYTDANENGKDGNGHGGAIYQTAGPLKIYSSSFSKNKAYHNTNGGGGSAIYANASSAASIEMTDVVLNGNIAQGSTSGNGSGTLYINSNITAKLSGCRFVSNSAGTRGGAIRVNGASTVYMDKCACYSNTVSTYASAIHVSSTAAKLAMNNCTVYLNTNSSTTGASAVYMEGDSFIANSTLRGESNEAILRVAPSTSSKSILANNIIVNATVGKPTIVTVNGAVTSYGHNIRSVLNDTNNKYSVVDVENHPDYPYEDAKFSQAWDSDNYILTRSALPTGFTKSSTSRILEAIKAFEGEDGAFATWLDGGYLVDALGTTRNTSGCWPGAYEGK